MYRFPHATGISVFLNKNLYWNFIGNLNVLNNEAVDEKSRNVKVDFYSVNLSDAC